MIDFSTVKSMVIPEGEVAEIRRGSEILWKKIRYKTELAYLESTGTQWIDVGIIPNNLTSLELTVSGVSDGSFSSSTGTWFLGARKAYLDNAFGFYYNQSTQNFYYAFGNVMPNAFYTSASLYGNVRTIRLDSAGLYVDNTKVVSITPKSFTSPVPLSLFGLNNDGTVVSRTSFRCHSMKVWDEDNLIRDLIPVLDLDDVACLYDKVTEKFYYNAGTGSFKYAELIDEEYESIEYLESTGREFIDTEMNISTSTDTVECVYQSLEDVKYKWIFGEHDTNARFGAGTGDGSGQRNVAYGTGTAKVADSYIFNNPHTLLADTTGVYIDGTKITSYKAFTSTSTIYLFNLNLNGTNYCNKARIYSYRHWRDGKLVREMIPVKRLLDGEAGLYDKANKVFYPLFTTFNLRREPTEEEMYQIWLEDIGHEEEIL